MNLTLLILTHNSQKELESNFGWLGDSGVVDEIVVVDDESVDKSIETIKKLAGKKKVIVKKRKLDNFSNQRNFGLEFTTNEMVLWLDPDEQISSHSLQMLNDLELSKNSVFCLKRREIFLGKILNYSQAGEASKPRIFNKKHGKFVNHVHETWQSDDMSIETDIILLHDSNKTVNIFFDKINEYSTMRANELFAQNITASPIDIVIYPLAKFLQNYIFYLGFLDGIQGTIFAFGMSFHSFLVRSKLWHLHNSR